MKYGALKITACALPVALLLFFACGEDVYFGIDFVNQPPVIQLIHGPLEGDTTVYKIHFYWMGHDPDGKIDYYEYVLTTGDPLGFNPADTTGLEKWTRTKLTDIELTATADEMDRTITINYNSYARYCKLHTFFVRAVDNQGMRSEAEYRSFNAFTLAPHIFITEPPPEPKVDTQFLTPVIFFKWDGKDPIDSPWNYQDVDSVRYLYTKHYGSIVEHLNEFPELFEDKWSPWFAFASATDSGKATILGDDEILEFNRTYIFVVQAKDEAGAVSSVFDEKTNVRRFMIKPPTGPLLEVREPYLGFHRFLGTNMNVLVMETPSGFPLNFSWEADASDYGAIVSTYRYGWDISDLSDPNEWAVEPSLYHKAAPQRRFFSGVHSFFIEVLDNIGIATLAKIEICIVPITMERDLLWVDDFMSDEFIQVIWATPTESQHDEFWLDICQKVRTFDPDIDVYDSADHFYEPPDIQKLWRYKSVIWTYGSARWDFNAWMKTIKFAPEGKVGGFGTKYTYNMMAYYMALGGHAWTCGMGERYGGMAASFPSKQWDWKNPPDILTFPLYLKCEITTGPSLGCIDTVGVESFPYREYCVTVVDKVTGVFRWDVKTLRNIEYDAMTYAYRDDSDPLAKAHFGLPEELNLWEEVTKPGRFFDPRIRGFHYVEIYDPEYWMHPRGFHSRSCFHPIYRMRARNTKSVIQNTIIAFWTTTYADVVPNAPGTVAAPSVQFGIPLWYFEHDKAHMIADVIFREWRLPLVE